MRQKRRRPAHRQLGAATTQRNEAITFGIMASSVMLGAFAGHRISRSGFAASIGGLAGFVLGSLAVGWRLSR